MSAMELRSLTLLPDHVVVAQFKSIVARDCGTTAEMLLHIGEVNARRLWADEGYQSMYDFCVRGLNMSEGVALKRIQAAKAVQAFPTILALVASGDLHLSAVCMLAPHLTPENATQLLKAATRKTKSGVAMVLATWFPRPAVPTSVQVLEPRSDDPDHVDDMELQAPGLAAGVPPVPAPTRHPKVAPLSAETVEIRYTWSKSAYDKLCYVQSLLGLGAATSAVPEVMERAIEALIMLQEKQKFAATQRPREQKGAPAGRHIPAQVKREVWERDRGRCTFVSASNVRCQADTRLEYDHIEPMANGGESTTQNLRLRCRAHNQLEAERRFGRGFMERKRHEARSARPALDADIATYDPDHTELLTRRAEIVPYLRKLGMRVEEANRGAAMCDHMRHDSLEARVKFALSGLAKARYERAVVRPGVATVGIGGGVEAEVHVSS